MSRFEGWDDGEEFAGQFALQMANTQRSLRGRKGQASLRALEAALLALPEKRLINGAVMDERGQVCAMGALAQHQGIEVRPATYEGEDYFDKTSSIARACGVPKQVGIEIAWRNDMAWGQDRKDDALTPEKRYDKMLAWVRENITDDVR